MRSSGLLAPLLVIIPALVSCSSKLPSENENGPIAGGGFGNDAGGGNGSSGSLGGGKTPGAPNDVGCSDASKLVYVVDDANNLYSFAPDKLLFSPVGRMSCPTAETPNSMAIDRAGAAWVNFSGGSLFKVSTSDASCQATGFTPGQGGFKKFGMAFATNSATSQDETLFVVGTLGSLAGKGLAKIDLRTMKLTTLGDFSGALAGQGAELTGTGDGRLFGFFTTQPFATLAQIDKASGATTANQPLNGVNTGFDWAVSFWGGDFWFYTSPGGVPSTVTRKQTSTDGSIATAKQDVGGFRIVGAGVSTCAPTAPPAPR